MITDQSGENTGDEGKGNISLKKLEKRAMTENALKI